MSVSIKEGDALALAAEVLAVKHAQARFGVDAAVYARFQAAGTSVRRLEPWEVTVERSPKGV